MPVTPTYPGVYIEEVPSGVRTITGVATSITAFIGRALRGPVNEPTTINSFGDFERVFGGLWSDSMLGYAVRDFYLNGGSQAIIVRLFHPYFASDIDRNAALAAAKQVVAAAGAAAIAPVKSAATGAYDPIPAAETIKKAAAKEVNDAIQALTGTATLAEVAAAADNAAKAAEVKAKEGAGLVADAAKSAGDLTAAKSVAKGAYDPIPAAETIKKAAAKEVNDAIQALAGTATLAEVAAAADSAAKAAGVKAEEGAKQVVADARAAAIAPVKSAAKGAYDAIPAAETIKKAAAKEVNDAIQALAGTATLADAAAAAAHAIEVAAPLTKAVLNADTLPLVAAYEGSWGNSLRVRVDHEVKNEAKDSDQKLFNLWVLDGKTGTIEVFRNVSAVAEHERRVDKVLENESKLVRVHGGLPQSRPAQYPPPPARGDVWSDNETPTNAKVAPEGTSSDGSPLDLNDFTGTGLEDKKQGLYALRKADLFNLLCIPPYLAGGKDVDRDLVSAAAAYCEKRRAMLLIDAPSDWTDKDKAKNKFSDADSDSVGTRSENAALFFPRLRQLKHDKQYEDFAATGAIAGVFARTDTQRGVWKAPAGTEATLVGVPQLTVSLTDDENGELNQLGINCLRAFAAPGRVVWGARTLQGNDRLASEWKYIPVRRTALFIEESLYRAMQWVVFEPNDEPLWSQIRMNIGAFMHSLFRQGAFQGTSPKDAYFVKCDKETTTQDDINKGIVNIVVGFAPLKPAEFVIIKLQQMAGQVQA